MNDQNTSALACRHCKHFHHEGRRGGMCQRLDVHVRGDWKPCPLMIPSFTTSWKQLEEMLPLQWRPVVQEGALERATPVPEKVLAEVP